MKGSARPPTEIIMQIFSKEAVPAIAIKRWLAILIPVFPWSGSSSGDTRVTDERCAGSASASTRNTRCHLMACSISCGLTKPCPTQTKFSIIKATLNFTRQDYDLSWKATERRLVSHLA